MTNMGKHLDRVHTAGVVVDGSVEYSVAESSGGGGWHSVVLKNDDQWLNIVILEVEPLIDVLRDARSQQRGKGWLSRRFTSKTLLDESPHADEPRSYRQMFLEILEDVSFLSLTSMVSALQGVTALWESLRSDKPEIRREAKDHFSDLLYEDEGVTLIIVEKLLRLIRLSEGPEVCGSVSEDLTLASSLLRLRSIASTFRSSNQAIFERCTEAMKEVGACVPAARPILGSHRYLD